MPREIVKEEEVTLPQVKKLLEQRQKEGELSYLQRLTFDYTVKFSKLSAEKAEGLLKRLKEDGISPSVASQIVNIMPTSVDELRAVFAGESKPVLPSELEKILSVVNSFRE
ncbi:MAG: DNA-directed RNA polymerase subunit F [Candidatus Verstraetearchaeota archaeon]|nr:DNA-directed RNA polymerase subunit F [Candidatus Verstraetearchaeota archaeon]